MRRYTISVNGKELVLDVRELSADRFQVGVNGRTLEVELVDDLALPQASITPAMGETRPVAAPPPPEPTNSGAVAPVPIAKPALANPATVAISKTLTAPMPGLIVSIDVQAGAKVKRGEQLLSLEAMKMVNAIRAPRDVTVAEVLVEKGKMVAFGEPLLRFEE